MRNDSEFYMANILISLTKFYLKMLFVIIINEWFDIFCLLYVFIFKILFCQLFLLGEYRDVILATLSYFHIYGMNTVINSSLTFGAKVITIPKFVPQMYIEKNTR